MPMPTDRPASLPASTRSTRPKWHFRRYAIPLGILLSLMASAAVAAYIVVSRLGGWIETAVVRKAAERGIILGVGQLEWSLDGVLLSNSNLTLSGVPSIAVKVDRLSADILVDFSGITVTRLQLQGAHANVLGSAGLVGFQLGYWTAKYASKVDLALRATDVNVEWKATPEQKPWLEVRNSTVLPQEGRGSLVAEQVVVAGQSIGTVGGAWTKGQTDFTIGLGQTAQEPAPIQVNVVHTGDIRSIDASLAPTSLAQLKSAFGLALADEKMDIEARIHLQLDTATLDSPASGWLKTTLHGYVPPHPPELDGFMFGNKTLFETGLFVDEARAKVRLEQTKVQAGTFVLKGSGVVLREEDAARMMLDLKGALPCTALAGAAIESRLGKVIGPWLRRAAEVALQGSVTVSVKVDADSRKLDEMRIARLIGIGCGLKPLKIPGFEDFELPELGNLPQLGDLLPPLPAGIPSLPGSKPAQGGAKPGSVLPSLQLPQIRWNRREDTERTSETNSVRTPPQRSTANTPTATPIPSAR